MKRGLQLFCGPLVLAALALACSSDLSGTEAATMAGPASPTGMDPNGVDGIQPLDGPASGTGSGFVRRLSDDEYRNTIADVLGIPIARGAVPVDVPKHGFKNNATGLLATPQHVSAYFEVSRSIVEQLDVKTFAATNSTCQSFDAACVESFLGATGLKLFRRPLGTRELEQFSRLFQAAATEGLTFVDGARLALRAMLQSPQFLYRLEAQRFGQVGIKRVTGYELASRLSYLLWASAPDAALLDAAASGALDTDEGVATQVARMLSDSSRAQRSPGLFVSDWALLFNLDSLSRDGLTDQLKEQFRDSLVASYQHHVLTSGQPIGQLFQTSELMLDGATAQWMGLASKADALAPYDVTRAPDRIGLLTHPAVLTAISSSLVGGMVARGLFMRENVLCQPPLTPPAGLNTADFTSHLAEDSTDRDYAEDRAANPACGACHGQFDPLAFGFERFNGVGQYVTENEYGKALRSDGELVTNAGRFPYETVAEYAALLSNDPQVQQCLTRFQLQFAIGEPLEEPLEGSLDAIHQAYLADGGSYPALVRALTSHPLFSTIVTE